MAECGEAAAWRHVEFFAVNIRNPNTRRAYGRTCRCFLAWCEDRLSAHGGIQEHAQTMAAHGSLPTTKLYGRIGDRLTREEVERIGL